MSLKLGTQDISGISQNTKYNAHHLLDFKWTDCIMNDVSWLRADTFSWQSGDVYTSAYNHLLADLQGTTAETETIGSYTVTFYRATDGHKIVLSDMESTVLNIYNESGIAWYYIVDATNTQFKLPRSTHGNIVEKYSNGVNWYRVWSDGWCEQGGIYDNGSLVQTASKTINLLRAMPNINYDLTATPSRKGTVNTATSIMFGSHSKTTTSFAITWLGYSGSDTVRYIDWKVCGYLNNYPENNQYKYLYFYVGDYAQSAIEQTAGLNAELFNDKADTDLGNCTRPYIVETYVNGANGYIIYSNGLCEQWGYSYLAGSTGQVNYNITLLQPYRDKNYSIQLTSGVGNSGWQYANGACLGISGTTPRNDFAHTTYFRISNPTGSGNVAINWRTIGYIS